MQHHGILPSVPPTGSCMQNSDTAARSNCLRVHDDLRRIFHRRRKLPFRPQMRPQPSITNLHFDMATRHKSRRVTVFPDGGCKPLLIVHREYRHRIGGFRGSQDPKCRSCHRLCIKSDTHIHVLPGAAEALSGCLRRIQIHFRPHFARFLCKGIE